MNIRVTDQSRTSSELFYMQQQSTQIATLHSQISSGNKVTLPSDDPVAYALAQQSQAESGQYATFQQNITSATSVLNSSVTTLQNVNDLLTQAQSLAQTGINSTNDSTSYAALADQVDSVLKQAIADGNTQVDGHYLYSGTADTTAPFQLNSAAIPNTVTYNGSTTNAHVPTGPGQNTDTRYAGSSVFQQAGGDVFQALIGLRDALRQASVSPTNAAANITTQLTAVQSAQQSIQQSTALQSSNLAALSALENQLTQQKLTSDTQTGNLTGTDYANAVVTLQQQMTEYQATLQVTGQLFQPNLLSFIK